MTGRSPEAFELCEAASSAPGCRFSSTADVYGRLPGRCFPASWLCVPISSTPVQSFRPLWIFSGSGSERSAHRRVPGAGASAFPCIRELHARCQPAHSARRVRCLSSFRSPASFIAARICEARACPSPVSAIASIREIWPLPMASRKTMLRGFRPAEGLLCLLGTHATLSAMWYMAAPESVICSARPIHTRAWSVRLSEDSSLLWVPTQSA